MLTPDTLLQERYQIIRQVGQGGMGSVYEARDTRLDKRVAVKQTITSEEQLQQAFLEEARLLARLEHEVLPDVTDYFIDGTSQFLVMDFIDGQDLRTLLHERNTPFSLEQVIDWADRLLDALEYLHAQEPPVIHRDIKPQNLKLTPPPASRLYLLDFGLAKSTSEQSVHAFTLQYSPPEQVTQQGTDVRSDLYALAVTLHHMLTRTDPPGVTTRLVAEHAGKPDPQPSVYTLNPGVPRAVSDVIDKAMAMDPDERYPTAAAMRAALVAAVAGQDVRTQRLDTLSPGAADPVEPTMIMGPSSLARPDAQKPHAPMVTSQSPLPSLPPGQQSLPTHEEAHAPTVFGQSVALPSEVDSLPGQAGGKKGPPVLAMVGGLVAVLLLLGAAGAGWYFIFPPANGPFQAGAPPRPPAPDGTGSTGNSAPALANQIVFVSNRDGNQEIYVMGVDGTNATRLTSTPAVVDAEPAISPDGRQIAFVSADDIFVMQADGTGQTRLTEMGNARSPTWSPDGSRIAFVAGVAIVTMQADGSGQTELTRGLANYRDLDWSPTGAQLAFESDGDIYVINIEGTGQINLTSSVDARDEEPAWSPNGSQLAFTSNQEGRTFDIYVMNADGTGQTNLTNGPTQLDRSPTWSPDGSQIAFRSSRDRNQEIYVMQRDGSGQTNLSLAPDADDTAPAWSPR